MPQVTKSEAARGRKKGLTAFFLLACGVCGFGAPPQIASPSLGVLFDSALGELKPIWGIPGAAGIGKPFELGQRLSAAAVCSARGFALGVARDEGQVLVISFGTGTVETKLLDGIPAKPDRLIVSPNCTSAALLYTTASQAQLVTGLPDHPSASSLDLSGLLAPPGIAAVNDSGVSLLVAASTKEATTIYRISTGGQPEFVFSAAVISAITFLRNSQDALVADPTSNQLLLVRSAGSGPPVPSPVASRMDGIADAVSIAVSSDNRHALVANASNQSVAIIDLQSQSGKQVPCDCQLDSISQLKNKSIFRLNDRIDRPITLLDIGGALPRLSLVPAEPPLEGGKP